MRSVIVAISAVFIAPVSAAWQSVYNANYSLVYIQSESGELYKLPISEDNVTTTEVESRMTQIASPPSNASIALDSDDHLLAVWGSQGCGNSPIEISQYDPSSNKWKSIAQSNINSQKWHLDSQIVWVDRSEDKVYIYGGACGGKTYSKFYSYDLTNNSFQEIAEQGKVMPRQMSSAQAIPLNNYETLLLGGRSGNAWMSMQQIATWGYGSWTFASVANSSNIDSRENPLLLPIWQYGQNGTAGAVNKILVVGGTVAGRDAKPAIALLQNSPSEGWVWTVPDQDADMDLSFAASTLYATLATVSSKSSTTSQSAKLVSLYGHNEDDNSWSPVKSVGVLKPSTKPSDNKSSHSTSTATTVVVSTLLPIIVICFIAVGAWWWLYKRRQRRLFLLPNKRGMLRRQPSESSSYRNEPLWSSSAQGPINASSFPRVPHREPDSGSIMMMESSEGNRLFMSKQRRSLRVVNPDAEDLQQQQYQHHRRISSQNQYQPPPPLPQQRAVADEGASAKSSRASSRDSSWSSTSKANPFEDNTDRRSEFDFDL